MNAPGSVARERLLRYPAISDYMDGRLSFNMLARGGSLRCTWIPKNMCTSLKFAFAEAEGVIAPEHLDDFLANPHWIHDWTWQLEPKSPLDVRHPGQESFAVLRRPASRLTSALVEKLIYQDADFERFVLPLLRYYAAYVQRPAEELTFQDFLECLAKAPDRLIDSHFQSQATLLSGSYTALFRFEEPDALADYLARRGMRLRRIAPHAIPATGPERLVAPADLIFAARAERQAQPGLRFIPDAALAAVAADVARRRFPIDTQIWAQLGSAGEH